MTFNPNVQLNPGQLQDRRGSRMGGGTMVAGGGGIGILFLIVSILLGADPFAGEMPISVQQPGITTYNGQSIADCQTGADANRREDCRMVGFVNSIQDYWSREFSGRGMQYREAETVLFTGAVQGQCGYATDAQGPFYCPLDQKVYLDISFFQELEQRFGASGGPFAQGYVVAHEYGHHIQNLAGLLGNSQRTGPESQAVGTELQADCFAGVWTHHATSTGYLQRVSEADIREALDAAGEVGDDRIQQRTQGRVTPESWTHGSAQQRQQWFTTGYRSGDLDSCDTRSR